MSIFLVEDDDIYNEFVTKSLSSRGYEIQQYYNAEDCLKDIENASPSHVIIDYQLPGMIRDSRAYCLLVKGGHILS